MDETHHYDALLEMYRKQEAPLNEKSRHLEEAVVKYQDALRYSMDLRDQWEGQLSKFNEKRLNLLEKLQRIWKTCEESDLSWKEIESKQLSTMDSQKKVSNISGIHLGISKGVARDLKLLDDEMKFENVNGKIGDYKNRTRICEQVLLESVHDLSNMSGFDPKLTDYCIAHLKYRKKSFPKKIGDINREITRIKGNLHSIDKEVKQLDRSTESRIEAGGLS